MTSEINNMQELCLLGGSHKTRTTPYHPESDGMVECLVRNVHCLWILGYQKNKLIPRTQLLVHMPSGSVMLWRKLMIRYDCIPVRQYNDRSAYTTTERSSVTLQCETG